MTDSDVLQQVGVNLLGPINVARAAEPYLRESNGHLVLFTSSSYTRGRAHYALYSATKAAVVNLAQALADEWSDDTVRVNVVNPERTRTPMRMQAFGDEPEHTLLRSDAVASTVLDLLSSDLTGQVIDVRRADAAPEAEADRVARATAEAMRDAGLDDGSAR
jgi:2-C-methyl-D-erythritol 4-phosphate cytidylyltransferase